MIFNQVSTLSSIATVIAFKFPTVLLPAVLLPAVLLSLVSLFRTGSPESRACASGKDAFEFFVVLRCHCLTKTVG